MGNRFSSKRARYVAPTVPRWVSALLKLPRNKVARLEFNDVSRERYMIMLDYLAHRAVDVNEPAPRMKEKLMNEASARKVPLSERECSGRLSSLVMDKPTDYERSLMSYNNFYSDEEISDSESDEGEEENLPRAYYLFGLGRARLIHNGSDVFVQHTEERRPVSSEKSQGTKLRRLDLFAADETVLRDLGETAVKWDFLRKRPDIGPREGIYELYTLTIKDEGVYWSSHGWKQSRSLDSVILPKGMLGSIVKDFRDFASSGTKKWYLSHGLPHRRSYLFYGPPGVGKTSTIRALCGELELPACFLALGDYKIGNSELQASLRNIPRPAMLVIEDIDALFNEDRKSDNPSPLTFSALLNSLDGLLSTDGILTVMTTNHIEKLDPALIRAGRVDRKFEFKLPSHEQMKALYASFYPDAEKSLSNEFADIVFARPEKQARSIATLQQHFIYTRGMSARKCVDTLDDFFKEFYPEGGYDRDSYLYV